MQKINRDALKEALDVENKWGSDDYIRAMDDFLDKHNVLPSVFINQTAAAFLEITDPEFGPDDFRAMMRELTE